MSRRLYHFSRQRQDATDTLAYVVKENVLAHRIVRLHGAQAQQAARFEQLSQHLRSLALKATRAAAATMPLTQLVSAIALSVVIGIALSQSQSNGQSITVGGFVAFIGAMLMLIAPMRRLSDVIDPVTRSLAALERGLDLLDSIPPESPATSPAQAPRARGDITLAHVRLTYPRANTPSIPHNTTALKEGGSHPHGVCRACIRRSRMRTAPVNIAFRVPLYSHGRP